MHEWYEDHAARDLFEENKDMAIYEISTTQKYEAMSNRQLKRLELQPLEKNQGYLGMFKKHNINQIAKLKRSHSEFPNGLYCVIDTHNVYIVFPQLKNGHMIADHLTFTQDNVHLTSYQPEPLDPNRGVVWHLPKCKLVDGTSLPISGYECKLLNKMGRFKNLILDVSRAYVVHTGGTPPSPRKQLKRSRPTTSTEISGTLELLLVKNNVKTMKFLCVRKDDSWDVMVTKDTHEDGYRFSVPRLFWPSIQKQMVEILSI